MKSAVIVFPGSNCDRDAFTVLSRLSQEPSAREAAPHVSDFSRDSGGNVIKVWHGDSELPKVDLVMLPGGFSYGDYLRSGAMAARSKIMDAVVKHANRGGYVLGVCNGFQILTESGLLDGTLMRNRDQKFLCKNVNLRVETTNSNFTRQYTKNQIINVPVAHHDGCYFASAETMKKLEGNDQVAFRYVDAHGVVNDASNINGSLGNIAGILNEKRNVLGMMPHPERHAEGLLGGIDGEALFKGLLAA